MNIEYEIKPFADSMVIVSRKEARSVPIKGLPPTTSQCIIMEQDEIENFMESLNECLQKMKSNNSVS
jgi:hypothetical protein